MNNLIKSAVFIFFSVTNLKFAVPDQVAFRSQQTTRSCSCVKTTLKVLGYVYLASFLVDAAYRLKKISNAEPCDIFIQGPEYPKGLCLTYEQGGVKDHPFNKDLK